MNWRIEVDGGREAIALDWLGNAVDCDKCPHAAMRAEGHCQKTHSCVQDRRNKRIERFFIDNPDLADSYLEHPYFEVRTIAARFASPFRLRALLTDEEPEVRAAAVMRLPIRQIESLRDDPDRRVRIAVAYRLEGGALVGLLRDKDYYVRLVAVRRLPPKLVGAAMFDPEPEVRRWVARSLEPQRLAQMIPDPDPLVRIEVANRLPPSQLIKLIADDDVRVRFRVAERIALDQLGRLAFDHEETIRHVVRERVLEASQRDLALEAADIAELDGRAPSESAPSLRVPSGTRDAAKPYRLILTDSASRREDGE